MKGSCLCGSVRYEIQALAGPLVHCSCRTCRKAHAAAFTTTVRVLRGDFRWVSGEETIRGFESSPGKTRLFCSRCGSHLLAERASAPYVIVRAATLDDSPHSAPERHIWTSHQVPWLEYRNVPSFEET